MSPPQITLMHVFQHIPEVMTDVERALIRTGQWKRAKTPRSAIDCVRLGASRRVGIFACPTSVSSTRQWLTSGSARATSWLIFPRARCNQTTVIRLMQGRTSVSDLPIIRQRPQIILNVRKVVIPGRRSGCRGVSGVEHLAENVRVLYVGQGASSLWETARDLEKGNGVGSARPPCSELGDFDSERCHCAVSANLHLFTYILQSICPQSQATYDLGNLILTSLSSPSSFITALPMPVHLQVLRTGFDSPSYHLSLQRSASGHSSCLFCATDDGSIAAVDVRAHTLSTQIALAAALMRPIALCRPCLDAVLVTVCRRSPVQP
ncbi:hypothetical protein MRB53_040623 [Persea americana]|nr:hypothetical protein MRB53_040623 [Persea americana]